MVGVDAVKRKFLCGVVHKLLKSLGILHTNGNNSLPFYCWNGPPVYWLASDEIKTRPFFIFAETKSRRTIWFRFYLTLRQRFSVYLGQARGSTREEENFETKRLFVQADYKFYAPLSAFVVAWDWKRREINGIIELRCDSTSIIKVAFKMLELELTFCIKTTRFCERYKMQLKMSDDDKICILIFIKAW